MTSKLDYLKKYLSKSDSKQLHSQIERGESIKIKNTTKMKKKRRKKPTQPTGITIGRMGGELDEKRDDSSDWSDGEGPTVAGFTDDSKERKTRMWNPISLNSKSRRDDSSSGDDRVVPGKRHDSDSETEQIRDDKPHSDSDLEVSRRVRHDSNDLTHSTQTHESDSDLDLSRKSQREDGREEGRRKRATRWSREERGESSRLQDTAACAMVVQSTQQDNQTIYRDKQGHKIDTEKEAAKRAEEEKGKQERDAKFKLMKSGIVQAKMREERAADFVEEAGKGLARYKEDDSLNEYLMAKELMEDPLIQMKSKKNKRKERKKRCKPTYQGTFPSNRFNIRPGYRWDGVDRSNGYEKERFQVVNGRKAEHEEYYKWSIEDM